MLGKGQIDIETIYLHSISSFFFYSLAALAMMPIPIQGRPCINCQNIENKNSNILWSEIFVVVELFKWKIWTKQKLTKEFYKFSSELSHKPKRIKTLGLFHQSKSYVTYYSIYCELLTLYNMVVKACYRYKKKSSTVSSFEVNIMKYVFVVIRGDDGCKHCRKICMICAYGRHLIFLQYWWLWYP